jgi:peptidyl-prolyl cis-trans isomerase D
MKTENAVQAEEPLEDPRRPRAKALLLPIVLLAAFGALVAASAFHVWPFHSKEQGTVIATVNGEPIYLDDARARYEGLFLVHGAGGQTLAAGWQERVLQSLADDRIVEDQAAQLGISVSGQELTVHVARLKGNFQTEEGFQGWLDSQHMDLAELERRIELQTLWARVYEAVTGHIVVSEEQARTYFDSHRGDYTNADGSPAPFYKARASIRDQIEKQARDQAFGAWLEQHRQGVNVVVLDDNWWRSVS